MASRACRIIALIRWVKVPGGIMHTLSNWFPLIDQMSPSMQALCSIVGVTTLVCAVVVFIVLRGKKGSKTE
jgi:hypothetical protein